MEEDLGVATVGASNDETESMAFLFHGTKCTKKTSIWCFAIQS